MKTLQIIENPVGWFMAGAIEPFKSTEGIEAFIFLGDIPWGTVAPQLIGLIKPIANDNIPGGYEVVSFPDEGTHQNIGYDQYPPWLLVKAKKALGLADGEYRVLVTRHVWEGKHSGYPSEWRGYQTLELDKVRL